MLELWGGIECTVNRVGDRYMSIRSSGLVISSGSTISIASPTLVCKALRYPVLWERVVPTDPAQPDWSWTDARLARLRGSAVRPICRPLSSRLRPPLDEVARSASSRATLRAICASGAASDTHGSDAFTPINEPLTTARFAALYGHWHPHARDEQQIVRALVHECMAVHAMRAIRQRQSPAPSSSQTEDLGAASGALRRLR